jgi:hypothetical protein
VQINVVIRMGRPTLTRSASCASAAPVAGNAEIKRIANPVDIFPDYPLLTEVMSGQRQSCSDRTSIFATSGT